MSLKTGLYLKNSRLSRGGKTAKFRNVPSPSRPSLICNLIEVRERTLEKATYICPWRKTGCGRSSPNRSYVYPCDLLIVENDSRIGNWCLRNLKGKNGSEGIKVIFGTRTRLPLLDPEPGGCEEA